MMWRDSFNRLIRVVSRRSPGARSSTTEATARVPRSRTQPAQPQDLEGQCRESTDGVGEQHRNQTRTPTTLSENPEVHRPARSGGFETLAGGSLLNHRGNGESPAKQNPTCATTGS